MTFVALKATMILAFTTLVVVTFFLLNNNNNNNKKKNTIKRDLLMQAYNSKEEQ